jgi:hypothetical protein
VYRDVNKLLGYDSLLLDRNILRVVIPEVRHLSFPRSPLVRCTSHAVRAEGKDI